MKIKNPTELNIEILDGVTLTLDGTVLNATGPKGKLSKDLNLRNLEMSISGKEITLKGGLQEVNTARTHVKNMMTGVTDGFEIKMIVKHHHFPMTLENKGKELIIKNFIGERKPRVAKIVGETKLEIKGKDITVLGPSKDDVGQTAANLRLATKITRKDTRIFQDGIYPVLE